MLMMRSVTSWRKSRLAGSAGSPTGTWFGFADAAMALQLSFPAAANSDSGSSFSNPDPANRSPPMSSSGLWPEALKDAVFPSALELATGLLFGRPSKSPKLCIFLLPICHPCRIPQNVTTDI
jgi:hypothetical protein